ncbi:GerMN domain-containing protein [Symbioplanes lichenis]|uniref:GerMN domain-containing protein n=1 Tax=Symbioplanes lichenis TaxID=1629072 RepID=UPI0027388985|nr:GerMN domain-containing protein [Actinoplanes lichenis]
MLVSVVTLTACGLPAQSEPHTVDLPRRPLTAPLPSVAAARPGAYAEILCLVRDDQLVQAVRRIDAPPDAQLQLTHLLAGPDEAERNTGLTSALTGLTLTVSRSPSGSEARVEVSESDESAAIVDDALTYGQIVCTLTSRADVSAVVFTRHGQRLEVPRADGSLSRDPLTGNDYAALIAPN